MMIILFINITHNEFDLENEHLGVIKYRLAKFEIHLFITHLVTLTQERGYKRESTNFNKHIYTMFVFEYSKLKFSPPRLAEQQSNRVLQSFFLIFNFF